MRNNEIQDLIKFVSKSGVSEVQIETEKIKLIIKNENDSKKKGLETQQFVQVAQLPQQSMPMSAPTVAQVAPIPIEAPKPAKEDTSKLIEVKSPMIGTFYRRPSPDKELFVNVGDEIKTGDVVCVIEAMKLFNEIESEVSGKIVKILVDDAAPVEYDQPLFLVDPS